MVTKAKRRKQNRSITPEMFVEVYVTHNSYEEVAKKLRISVSSVKNKLYALKKLGVKLVGKKKSKKDVNINLLNDIIKKYRK